MRLPVSQNLPLVTLVMLLAAAAPAQARERSAAVPENGPQADYPIVLGKPFVVDGVTYTPADTQSYDVVGWAATAPAVGHGITASHRTLPLPSYAEITALDTGRTILVRFDRRGPMTGRLLTELSPEAAEQLGIVGQARAAVRVRRVNPPEPERGVLRSGNPAPVRMETPPALRSVLRRKLEQQGAGTQVSRPSAMITPDRARADLAAIGQQSGQRGPIRPAAVTPPSTEQTPAVIPPKKGDWYVQVGAFSVRQRAATVAADLGGQMIAGRGIWRVRIAGLSSRVAAEAALAKARRAGYRDARIQQGD
ncbi:MAG: SPOR domain-containing protein [Novosphingobium sp.]